MRRRAYVIKYYVYPPISIKIVKTHTRRQLGALLDNRAPSCIHHHQPINVPTVGAQAFLMDYTQGERVITHHAGQCRLGGTTTANAAETNGSTCLPNHEKARDNKFC
jgi:hypothetical protein